MQPELFAPFISSVRGTFETMLSCAVEPHQLPRLDAHDCFHDVTGIMSMTGRAEGSLVLSLSREVALRAASALLMVEADEINADVIDAVGELTNMVAGMAKAKLEEYEIRIGLPSVVCGTGHSVNFPSSVEPLSQAFVSEWGILSLTVGLVVVEAPLECITH